MHPFAMFKQFDSGRKEFLTTYTGVSSKTKKEFTCEVEHERFLAPEVWFSLRWSAASTRRPSRW
jgi:hypothetical protein